MTTALWAVQIILALIFGAAGVIKLTQPKAKLEDKMTYVEEFSQAQVRLIGLLELLAAIGLIVPPLVGLMPQLAAWAGVGLVLTMIGAIITHVRRNEPRLIGMNVVLLLCSAFVAAGYFGLLA